MHLTEGWCKAHPVLRAGYRSIPQTRKAWWGPHITVPGRTGRWDRPCDRINSALERLSRDRWVSGDERLELACRFARLVDAGNVTQILRGVVGGELPGPGMIRGKLVAWPHQPGYGALMSKLSRAKKPLQAELIILNFILKGG